MVKDYNMEKDKNPLWVERYRPTKIEDVILPKNLEETFKSIVEGGTIPNMILNGPAGTGKTTVAKAICAELDSDYIFINGSDERNIDTLRNKIRQFASTVSFGDGVKVVIIDEADYLNPQSTQPAMRGFIEEFSDNCRFIMTCNNKSKIIKPLHSRCTVLDYTIPRKELPNMAARFFERCKKILDAEGIEYSDKVLVSLIQDMAPDWRQVLQSLQSYSLSGKIDSGILAQLDESTFNELVTALKAKNFRDMRKWVATHMDLEPTVIFRKLYDCMSEKVSPKSIPNLVLILGEWQYKSAHVMDQEINTVACMTEIMAEVEWN